MQIPEPLYKGNVSDRHKRITGRNPMSFGRGWKPNVVSYVEAWIEISVYKESRPLVTGDSVEQQSSNGVSVGKR